MEPPKDPNQDVERLLRILGQQQPSEAEPPYSPPRIIYAEAINVGFIIAWVALQWGLHSFLQLFPLHGVDAWIVTLFIYLFAFSTLFPIVVFIYVDTRIILIRAAHAVRTEKQRFKS